jgi:hypothetical protein
MTAPKEPSNQPSQGPEWTTGLSDADFRNCMLRAIRLLTALAVLVAALFWWKAGWQSASLLGIGAAISAWSLWEWLRLMTALNQRMDVGATPRPMGMILVGFFVRIGLTLAVLYGSLKYLHGTVFALAAGLGLGVLSLTVEALRLIKRWTV